MAHIRRRFGRITASLDATEARLLRTLVSEVADLVAQRGEQTQTSEPLQTSDDATGSGRDTRGERGDVGDTSARDPLVDLVGMDVTWDEAAAELAEEGSGASFGRERLQRPDDPALARLFPDAYGDDEESASDFRRMTESSLREGKLAAARMLLETLPADGGSIRLGLETAEVWLSALNDVRLALGTRIGVTDDTDLEIDTADPENRLMTVYLWVGALQQQLVDAVTGSTSPF